LPYWESLSMRLASPLTKCEYAGFHHQSTGLFQRIYGINHDDLVRRLQSTHNVAARQSINQSKHFYSAVRRERIRGPWSPRQSLKTYRFIWSVGPSQCERSLCIFNFVDWTHSHLLTFLAVRSWSNCRLVGHEDANWNTNMEEMHNNRCRSSAALHISSSVEFSPRDTKYYWRTLHERVRHIRAISLAVITALWYRPTVQTKTSSATSEFWSSLLWDVRVSMPVSDFFGSTNFLLFFPIRAV